MEKIDNLKVGTKYLFITKDNKEYKGVLIDKDIKYVYLKNVKYGGRFATAFTLPIDLLARVS